MDGGNRQSTKIDGIKLKAWGLVVAIRGGGKRHQNKKAPPDPDKQTVTSAAQLTTAPHILAVLGQD